jgi:N-acetylglucosamine-6-phosphate deacetylase
MPSLLIRGSVVAGAAVRPGWVGLRDGLIAGVGEGPPPAGFGVPVELGDLLIAPGFVDLHVHGGAGGQAAGDDPADVAE